MPQAMTRTRRDPRDENPDLMWHGASGGLGAQCPSVPTPAGRSTTDERRFRGVLAGNTATSVIGGVAAAVAASWWADKFGISSVGWTRAVSAALVVFGFDCWAESGDVASLT